MFIKWIHLKLNEKQKHTIKNNHKKTRKQKGGKWSLKYKQSINCKRPKGFSQKQYCKYSRRRH